MYGLERLRAAGVIAGTVMCLMGCATPREAPPRWMPLTPGTVAIVGAGFPPAQNFNSLAKGRSAAAAEYSGAAGNQAGAAAAAAPLRDPRLLLLGPLLPFAVLGAALVGTVGGAVYGAVHGLPEDHAKALQQAIDGAFRDLQIQDTLARSVLNAASAMSYYKVEYLAGEGPGSSTEQPDYSSFRKRGFHSVLEVVVTDVGFTALQGSPPRVALDMAARVRLVPTNGGPSRERKFEVGSRPRPAQEWADDDGRLLQQAFEHSYRTLTRYIVESAFAEASLE